jgi:hypothetical protein
MHALSSLLRPAGQAVSEEIDRNDKAERDAAEYDEKNPGQSQGPVRDLNLLVRGHTMSQPSRSGTSRAESETKPRARTGKLLLERRQYALTDKDGSHDKDTGDLLFLEVVRRLRRAGRCAAPHALVRVCALVLRRPTSWATRCTTTTTPRRRSATCRKWPRRAASTSSTTWRRRSFFLEEADMARRRVYVRLFAIVVLSCCRRRRARLRSMKCFMLAARW